MKLILWTLLGLSVVLNVSCINEKKDPVVAIVNGIEIKTSQVSSQNLDQQIEQTVLQTESKRIGISQSDMLGFFDSLKTRNIPKDQIDDFVKKEFKDKSIAETSRAEIINLMREKQFEAAKKKYISELVNRSTIWVIRDGQKVKYVSSQK